MFVSSIRLHGNNRADSNDSSSRPKTGHCTDHGLVCSLTLTVHADFWGFDDVNATANVDARVGVGRLNERFSGVGRSPVFPSLLDDDVKRVMPVRGRTAKLNLTRDCNSSLDKV
jgi:hypothetical protein